MSTCKEVHVGGDQFKTGGLKLALHDDLVYLKVAYYVRVPYNVSYNVPDNVPYNVPNNVPQKCLKKLLTVDSNTKVQGFPSSPPTTTRNAFYAFYAFYLYYIISTYGVTKAQSTSITSSPLTSPPTSSAIEETWVPQHSSNTPSVNSSFTAKVTKPKSSPKAPPSKTSLNQPSTSPARNAALAAPP